jgi:hypothetical protein
MSRENHLESFMLRSVLLFGFKPPFKERICEFLLAAGCTCSEATSRNEIERATFDALLLDLTNTSHQAVEIISAIKQIRPEVSKRILLITDPSFTNPLITSPFITNPRQAERLLHDSLPEISREAPLPQLWAKLQEIFALQTVRNPVPRGMVVAQLIFDSFQSPPTFGVRGSMQDGSRQLAYQHNSTKINLLIQGNSEQVSLVGQVLDVSLRDVNERPVLLSGTDGELKRTSTSLYGEFGFEFEFVRDASLRIHLSDGAWIYMPLEGMDWLKKMG